MRKQVHFVSNQTVTGIRIEWVGRFGLPRLAVRLDGPPEKGETGRCEKRQVGGSRRLLFISVHVRSLGRGSRLWGGGERERGGGGLGHLAAGTRRGVHYSCRPLGPEHRCDRLRSEEGMAGAALQWPCTEELVPKLPGMRHLYSYPRHGVRGTLVQEERKRNVLLRLIRPCVSAFVI